METALLPIDIDDPSTAPVMTVRQHRRAVTAPADFFMLAAAASVAAHNQIVGDESLVGAAQTAALEEETAAIVIQTASNVIVEAQQQLILATTVIPAVIQSVAAVASSLDVETLLQNHRVQLNDQALADSISQLDQLIAAFDFAVQTKMAGIAASSDPSTMIATNNEAPGFFVHTPVGASAWRTSPTLPSYKTLALHECNRLPLGGPEFFLDCFRYIRTVLECRQNVSTEDCSCFTEWDFTGSNRVSFTLVFLALEQLMVAQANQVLQQTVHVPTWNASYLNHSKGSQQVVPRIHHPDTRIRLLRSRDDYAEVVMQCCLAAQSSIRLNTCYLHGTDPFVYYLFMTVLPYCARKHGVQVQIMIDLMTIEGAMVQSAFQPPKAQGTGSTVTSTSFLQRLDENAPPFEAPPASMSMMYFLQKLLKVCNDVNVGHEQNESSRGTMEVRWWCAQDAKQGYRIKNHTKGILVDERVAIMGGSNVCPTMAAALTEVDLVVTGSVVKEIEQSTQQMWDSLQSGVCNNQEAIGGKSSNDWQEQPNSCGPVSSGLVLSTDGNNTNGVFIQTDPLSLALRNQTWTTTTETETFFLRSSPSSDGDDCILRAVLEAISTATTSVHMTFGHCNFPEPVCQALRTATEERNVSVKLIVNSLYSCDLRGGQQDLFRSIQRLLTIAPKVEVYSTALKSNGCQDTKKPPFLHAKYVTIDGSWSAVGSWNLWHRSAFFEIEHELILPNCPEVAAGLVQKFEEDQASFCVRVQDPQACCSFLPQGCMLCQGFASFYTNEMCPVLFS
jgi:phosphatidylserine/phosphatidylglycerophosphate/cardiolipin synthase-like enzyme